MKFKTHTTRILGGSICLVLFLTQVVWANSAEANFWGERQKKIGSFQVASLPKISAPQIQNQILQNISSLNPDIKRSSSLASLPFGLNARFGSINKIVPPLGKPNGKRILLIQDIHLNAEAQKNIGSLIEQLGREKSIDLVALEGLFSSLDLSRYQQFSDQAAVKAVADYLLREKRISGAVHAGFVGGSSTPFFAGIDDVKHYNANVAAYQKASPIVEKVQNELNQQEKEIFLEKTKIFNPMLAELDRTVESYRKGGLSLGAYLEFLSKRAQLISPTVQTFLRAWQYERTLDYPAVEEEKRQLISGLIQKLSKAQTDFLLQASVEYRMGNLSHKYFYDNFKNLCAQAGLSLSRFSAIDSYIQYVLLSDQIDATLLFSEIRQLEEDVLSRLAKTKKEKELIQASLYLELAKKLSNFSLSPDEWMLYRKFSSHKLLKSFEQFYEKAQRRNDLMVKNLLSAVESKAAKNAAVVVGGFHAAEMARLLSEEGFDTVIYTPKINQVDTVDGSSYLSVFTQVKTPLDRLFEGEKLFVTPPPAAGESLATPLIGLSVQAKTMRPDAALPVIGELTGNQVPKGVSSWRTFNGAELRTPKGILKIVVDVSGVVQRITLVPSLVPSFLSKMVSRSSLALTSLIFLTSSLIFNVKKGEIFHPSVSFRSKHHPRRKKGDSEPSSDPEHDFIYYSFDYHISRDHFDRRIPFIEEARKDAEQGGAEKIFFLTEGVLEAEDILALFRQISQGEISTNALSITELERLQNFSRKFLTSRKLIEVEKLLRSEEAILVFEFLAKIHAARMQSFDVWQPIEVDVPERDYLNRMIEYVGGFKADLFYEHLTGDVLRYTLLQSIFFRLQNDAIADGDIENSLKFAELELEAEKGLATARAEASSQQIIDIKKGSPRAAIIFLQGDAHRYQYLSLEKKGYRVLSQRSTFRFQDMLDTLLQYSYTGISLSPEEKQRFIFINFIYEFLGHALDKVTGDPVLHNVLMSRILNGQDPMTGEKKIAALGSEDVKKLLSFISSYIKGLRRPLDGRDVSDISTMVIQWMKDNQFWIPAYDALFEKPLDEKSIQEDPLPQPGALGIFKKIANKYGLGAVGYIEGYIFSAIFVGIVWLLAFLGFIPTAPPQNSSDWVRLALSFSGLALLYFSSNFWLTWLHRKFGSIQPRILDPSGRIQLSSISKDPTKAKEAAKTAKTSLFSWPLFLIGIIFMLWGVGVWNVALGMSIVAFGFFQATHLHFLENEESNILGRTSFKSWPAPKIRFPFLVVASFAVSGAFYSLGAPLKPSNNPFSLNIVTLSLISFIGVGFILGLIRYYRHQEASRKRWAERGLHLEPTPKKHFFMVLMGVSVVVLGLLYSFLTFSPTSNKSPPQPSIPPPVQVPPSIPQSTIPALIFNFPPRASDAEHDFIYYSYDYHVTADDFKRRIPFLLAAMEDANKGGAKKFVLWTETGIDSNDVKNQLDQIGSSNFGMAPLEVQKKWAASIGLTLEEHTKLFQFAQKVVATKTVEEAIALFEGKDAVLAMEIYAKAQNFYVNQSEPSVQPGDIGFTPEFLKFKKEKGLGLLVEQEYSDNIRARLLYELNFRLAINYFKIQQLSEFQKYAKAARGHFFQWISARSVHAEQQIKKYKKDFPGTAILAVKGLAHRFEHQDHQVDGYRIVPGVPDLFFKEDPINYVFSRKEEGPPLTEAQEKEILSFLPLQYFLVEYFIPIVGNQLEADLLAGRLLSGEDPISGNKRGESLTEADVILISDFLQTHTQGRLIQVPSREIGQLILQWFRENQRWVPKDDEILSGKVKNLHVRPAGPGALGIFKPIADRFGLGAVGYIESFFQGLGVVGALWLLRAIGFLPLAPPQTTTSSIWSVVSIGIVGFFFLSPFVYRTFHQAFGTLVPNKKFKSFARPNSKNQKYSIMNDKQSVKSAAKTARLRMSEFFLILGGVLTANWSQNTAMMVIGIIVTGTGIITAMMSHGKRNRAAEPNLRLSPRPSSGLKFKTYFRVFISIVIFLIILGITFYLSFPSSFQTPIKQNNKQTISAPPTFQIINGRRFDFPKHDRDPKFDYFYFSYGYHLLGPDFWERQPFLQAAVQDARANQVTKVVLWDEAITDAITLGNALRRIAETNFDKKTIEERIIIAQGDGLTVEEYERLYAFSLKYPTPRPEEGVIRFLSSEETKKVFDLFAKRINYFSEKQEIESVGGQSYEDELTHFAQANRLHRVYERQTGAAIRALALFKFYETRASDLYLAGEWDAFISASRSAQYYFALAAKERFHASTEQLRMLKAKEPRAAIICLKGFLHREEHGFLAKTGYQVVTDFSRNIIAATPSGELFLKRARNEIVDPDEEARAVSIIPVYDNLFQYLLANNVDRSDAHLAAARIIRGENPLTGKQEGRKQVTMEDSKRLSRFLSARRRIVPPDVFYSQLPRSVFEWLKKEGFWFPEDGDILTGKAKGFHLSQKATNPLFPYALRIIPPMDDLPIQKSELDELSRTIANAVRSPKEIGEVIPVFSQNVESLDGKTPSGGFFALSEADQNYVLEAVQRLLSSDNQSVSLPNGRKAILELHGYKFENLSAVIGASHVALDLTIEAGENISPSVQLISKVISQLSENAKLIIPRPPEPIQEALTKALGEKSSRMIYLEGKERFFKEEGNQKIFLMDTFLAALADARLKDVFVTTQGAFEISDRTIEYYRSTGILNDIVLLTVWLNGLLGLALLKNKVPTQDLGRLTSLFAKQA